MKLTLIAMTIAAALTVYWIEEYAECLLNPGTDECTECTDDCLDKE